MITGIFIENVPFIKVILGWERSIQSPAVVLDTGFTGDLQITTKIAKELNLIPIGASKIKLANGQIVNVPIANAIASMEGMVKNIQVLIVDGMPLVGINFLSKFSYKAIVDCRYKKVLLERVI